MGPQQLMNVKDKNDLAIRTQDEVAQIMTERGFPMGRSNVYDLERRAIKKLKCGLATIASELGYGQEGAT